MKIRQFRLNCDFGLRSPDFGSIVDFDY